MYSTIVGWEQDGLDEGSVKSVSQCHFSFPFLFFPSLSFVYVTKSICDSTEI